MVPPPARVALAFLAAILLSACQPHQMYPGPRQPRERVAVVCVNPDVTLSHRTLDGVPLKVSGGAWEAAVLPGEHRFGMRVEWSNRHRDDVELLATLEAGQHYKLGGRETWPPPKPPTTRGAVGSAAVHSAVGVGTVAMNYTSPILAPGVLVYMAIMPPPKAAPAGHRMELWIQQEPDGPRVAQWTCDGPPPAQTD